MWFIGGFVEGPRVINGEIDVDYGSRFGLVFKMGGFTMLGMTKFASLTETERMEKAMKKIEALLLSSSKGDGGGALGQVSIVEEVCVRGPQVFGVMCFL